MLSMTFLISVGFCDIEKKKREKAVFFGEKTALLSSLKLGLF